MSRTQKEIDWDKVNLYLKAGASQKKIAESLGIDRDTLRDRVKEKYGEDYSAYSASLHSMGELLIEVTQFQKALSGNIQMLLWLGKIRLGQKEPDLINTKAPSQEDINKDHIIMELQHKLAVLEENANQSKTE